ncbi:MAG: ABC transporter ATP-binding protein [Halothece sp.]
MLSATNFTFAYPGVKNKALTDISLTVQQGEVLGIVGPNGAGKTTLCMALAGFVPRLTGGNASGELKVAGLDPREVSGEEVAKQVGMVFEDYASQITQITVLDEVMAPLVNRGVSLDNARSRAEDLLEKMGLFGVEHKRTWELSGGQQQRIAIAAALAIDPPILILDNVTGMLDFEGKEEVRKTILDLTGETTLIVVEDDTNLLVEVAQRIVILNEGKMIADDYAENIFSEPTLVSKTGVDAPISLQVAKTLGIDGNPLTLEQFKESTHPLAFDLQASQRNLEANTVGKPILSFQNVSYQYPDGTTALEDINLEIGKGEVHAIVGGNGAGKTTVTKLIIGLLKPTQGDVWIGQANTSKHKVADLALSVGTAFQNPDEQMSEKNVAEELAFPLKVRQYEKTGWFSKQKRYDDAYIDRQVSHVLKLVGLEESLRSLDPIMLPFGQRKLVTIAEALILNPLVLVLDEPRVGLDATGVRQLQELIAQLQSLGKAVILVEHDIDFVCEVANRVTVLNQGYVMFQGTTHTVFSPQNWGQLSELYIRPPRLAQMTHQIGLNALNFNDLHWQLPLVRKVS